MEKATITYDRSGPSGNIYAILGAVSQALRKQSRYTDFNTLRDRVFEAQSYEEALKIIGETVNLVEIHK
jgi:hypothetical protein